MRTARLALLLVLAGVAAVAGNVVGRGTARTAVAPVRVEEPAEMALPGEPDEVRALEAAIERLRAFAETGGWIRVPADRTLRRGDRGRPVALLAARLVQEGDLDEANAPRDLDLVRGDTAQDADGEGGENAGEDGGPVYDEALVQAVTRYQHRHGLRADGIAGPATLGAMAVPIGERIRTLEANLRRAQSAHEDDQHVGKRLVVNVPDFELRLVDADGSILRTHRLVIGKQGRHTPTLQSKIDTIVLNPFWYVPHSIASTEILAQAQEDPESIARQHFSVFGPDGEELDPDTLPWDEWETATFPYRIRQEPGPWNALGRVKFLFDNSHAVYLHDTPATHLFQRHERDFSHGCIRVEHPLELAAALLGEEWTAERLEKARRQAGDRPRVFELSDPVPIEILYRTAWVGTDGALRFRADVYGLDRADGAGRGG